MKRKSVSEPSWERIDHVYTSTLYLSLPLSLPLPQSGCRAHLSPCLLPFVCQPFFFQPFPAFLTSCSSSLTLSLPLLACPCLFLSQHVMQINKAEVRWELVLLILFEMTVLQLSPQHVAHLQVNIKQKHVEVLSFSTLKILTTCLYDTLWHNSEMCMQINISSHTHSTHQQQSQFSCIACCVAAVTASAAFDSVRIDEQSSGAGTH